VEERDRHLSKQVSEIQEDIARLEDLIGKDEANRKKGQETIVSERRLVDKRQGEIKSKEKELSDVGEELSRLVVVRSEKLEEKKVSPSSV